MRKGWLLLSLLLVACAYTRVEPTTILSPLQPVSATAVLPAASPRTTHGLPLLSQTAPTLPAPTAMLTPTAIPVPISTPTAVTAAPSQAMTVIGQESVNARESPDLDAAVVAQVEPGDDVLLIGPAVSTADGSSRALGAYPLAWNSGLYPRRFGNGGASGSAGIDSCPAVRSMIRWPSCPSPSCPATSLVL